MIFLFIFQKWSTMAAFHPYTLTQTLAENSITPLQDTPLHSTKVNELFHTVKSPIFFLTRKFRILIWNIENELVKFFWINMTIKYTVVIVAQQNLCYKQYSRGVKSPYYENPPKYKTVHTHTQMNEMTQLPWGTTRPKR